MSVSKWRLVKRTFSVWWSHHATRLAAAVSFYAMLAIAPLMVVALNVLSWIYGGTAEQRIGQQVDTFVGAGGNASPGKAIQQVLEIAARSRHGTLAVMVSFVIALVSGSSLFSSVQDAINTLWDIQPRRDAPFKAAVRNRIAAGAMLFVVAVLLLASFVLSAALAIVTRNSVGRIAGVTYIGDTLLSFALVTLLFAMIYKFLPPAKIVWSDVWLGALMTAGLFIAGRIALAFYFWFASMRNPYGAAGSLAALLLWIYYSSMLVFFGAAFTRVYAESRGKPIEPDDYGARAPDAERRQSAAPSKPGAGDDRPDLDRHVSRIGLALAALAGGVGTSILGGKGRRQRAGALALRVPERLQVIESRLRRAEKLQIALTRARHFPVGSTYAGPTQGGSPNLTS